jgi:hypothetical protein
MAANGAAIRAEAFPAFDAGAPQSPASPAAVVRATLYGDLVGEGANQVVTEQRLLAAALAQAAAPEPADMVHRVSVAAGYGALAIGCAATALGVAALF